MLKNGGENTLESIRLETEITEIEGIKVLKVAGEIDVYTAPQFKDAVNKVIGSGQKYLIIDMSGVTYMNSSCFGTLISATKRLRPQGGSVLLVKCNTGIDRILKITRLNTVFNTFSSIEEAIKSAKV